MEDKKSEFKDLFKNMLLGDDTKVLQEFKQSYVSSLSNALALSNMTLVMYLFYKLILKSNMNVTAEIFNGILKESHKALCIGLLESVKEGKESESSIIQDIEKDLLSKAEKIFEESFHEISHGIMDSLSSTISYFEKVSKLQSEDNPKENSPSQ